MPVLALFLYFFIGEDLSSLKHDFFFDFYISSLVHIYKIAQ